MKTKALTPHQQMTKLDSKGESYWLEKIFVMGGRGVSYETADVISHSEAWLCLKLPKSQVPVWLNLAHVLSFKIVEG